jgi:hypothetical protein
MKANRVILLSCISLVVGGSWLYVTHLRADETEGLNSTPNQTLVGFAKEALVATEAAYFVNQASLEEIYEWSKRLMDAELLNGVGDDAVSAHLERMREKHRRAEALFQAGARGVSPKDYAAARYYLMEAESMMAARSK